MSNEKRVEISEGGLTYSCVLLESVDFQGKSYAVLLNQGPAGAARSEPGDIVVMRLVREGESERFEVINDEDEFEAVSTHLEEISQKRG